MYLGACIGCLLHAKSKLCRPFPGCRFQSVRNCLWQRPGTLTLLAPRCRAQLADSQKEVRRLGQLLETLEAAGTGNLAKLSRGEDDDGARGSCSRICVRLNSYAVHLAALVPALSGHSHFLSPTRTAGAAQGPSGGSGAGGGGAVPTFGSKPKVNLADIRQQLRRQVRPGTRAQCPARLPPFVLQVPGQRTPTPGYPPCIDQRTTVSLFVAKPLVLPCTCRTIPQERRIQELEGQLADTQQQLDSTKALRAISQDALDQARWGGGRGRRACVGAEQFAAVTPQHHIVHGCWLLSQWTLPARVDAAGRQDFHLL